MRRSPTIVKRWSEFVRGTAMRFRTSEGAKAVTFEHWSAVERRNVWRRRHLAGKHSSQFQ